MSVQSDQEEGAHNFENFFWEEFSDVEGFNDDVEVLDNLFADNEDAFNLDSP
jgi:hypothetical protein